MESDCESVDSGLEESGHSNLEVEGGGFVEEFDEAEEGSEGEEEGGEVRESIYENAAVLKQSTAYLTPVTATIEKYQFGGEEEEQEQGVVAFPALDMGSTREKGSTLWGVRQAGMGSQRPVVRSSNPTEDKIAKEIRELKEREEELVRRRESKSPSPAVSTPSPTPSVQEERQETPRPKSQSEKFNPSLYRPIVAPPRPRIMEDFISNGGRVTAFVQPDHAKEMVQLRKPTVHKSVPKVQAPTALTRQPTGTVLDKIQAELAETRRREEELKRSRRQMSRSQPDLTKVLPTGPNLSFDPRPDSEPEMEEEEEEPSSILQTRGKSALISVWESRIQSEQAA